MKKFYFLIPLLLSTQSIARLKCDPKIDLNQIDKRLKSFINIIPTKFNNNCEPITESHSFLFKNLSPYELKKFKFVESKNQAREILLNYNPSKRIKADERENDKHYLLVDGLSENNRGVENIFQMDEMKLISANLEETPWSDDYWALAKGTLAYRYADPAMQDVYNNPDRDETDGTWKQLYDFYLTPKAHAANYVERQEINLLSPAEKYDLLIGDENYSFTKWMWAQGEQYYYADNDEDGEPDHHVEGWMGICHGWAAASYMLERPTNSVVVKSSQGGHDIHFTPADIKSLASQLWAVSQSVDEQGVITPNKFIGGRCNEKEPEIHEETGRIIDPDCFDNSPSSWHKSVVNQIGVAKRSLVMDATFDYEVWNHPLVSYSYIYFNPVTKKEEKNINQAIANYTDYKDDPFKEYRSKDTKKIIGIIMEVSYVVEVAPTTSDTAGPENDYHQKTHYAYDLELDEEGNIIAGEWYTNMHPDFLWSPIKNSQAKSQYEIRFPEHFQNTTWDPTKDAVPEMWSFFAKPITVEGQRYTGASESGQPLASIVEKLIFHSVRGDI